MSYLDKLRQSGRITRMIEEANRLADQGDRVCIVMADRQGVRQVITYLNPSIKVVPASCVAWIDWQAMTIDGEDQSTIVLIDHRVIEQQYAKQLEMLHRFDDDDLPS